jgi:hypothetical protein
MTPERIAELRTYGYLPTVAEFDQLLDDHEACNKRTRLLYGWLEWFNDPETIAMFPDSLMRETNEALTPSPREA